MSVRDLIMAAGMQRDFWTVGQKLTASDAALNDMFGIGLSMSRDGNTLAVGAWLDDNYGGTDAGSVYVFVRTGSVWTQQAIVQHPNASAVDLFGYSVALSANGNTMAVGCYRDDPSGVNDAGSVFIFFRVGTTWNQQGAPVASGAAANDWIGWSVAISDDGNTLAVGATQDDNSGGSNAGSVYIFTRSGETWSQQTRLQASDAAVDDFFGYSLSLSSDGNTLAVGSWGDDNSGGASSGSVYVFTRAGTVWTQQTRLQASDAAANDGFGRSVSLSSDGNTLAVGSSSDDTSGGVNSGSVYVFTRAGTVWTQQTRLQASDASQEAYVGYSVSLSSDGQTLAVGASGGGASGASPGSVYVFYLVGGAWVQKTKVTGMNPTEPDRFGEVVSISGDGGLIAASAPSANLPALSDAGAVYMIMR